MCAHCKSQEPASTPSVPPSSAVQGSVRTEGPTEGARRLREALKGYSVTAEQAAANLLANAPQAVCGPLDADEPPVEDRLRALATAELEAAKGGTRIQKTAAKAAARAYWLAADMIEEEA